MGRVFQGLLLLLCLPSVTMARAPANVRVHEDREARAIVDLAEGWRFRFGVEGTQAAAPEFDDRTWQTVSVPHSWNRIGEYAAARSGTTNNAQGIGWYRLWVNAPPAGKGQRQYLDFAAVGAIADVWVNGAHVGRHQGAFSRFRLDVTARWRPGQPNLVAVRADNAKPAVGSTTEHVIPLAGDFFVHGGIYRAVSLVTANETGIDMLDHGGPGVYVRTAESSPERARIVVSARFRDFGRRLHRSVALVTIRDAKGTALVERMSMPVRPDAPGTPGGRDCARVCQQAGVPVVSSRTGQGSVMIDLPRPRLWNGLADPYLYSVTVELVGSDHRVLDSVTQPFGIRSFRIDADEGFFLNGRHLKLHGVSRHQDRPDRGWALTRADHAQDMAIIKQMGANTVRMAHYQHADEWVEEADKAGMIVWAEVPYVATPSLSGGQGSPELWANAEQQLRELIRQNYNHPSIAMWSIGNEVDSAKGFGVAGDPPKPLALLRHLNRVAKEEDPSRPTVFADCCEDLGLMQTAGEALAGTADLIGYNRYYGWYYPQPLKARDEFAAHMDRLHARHPGLPISVSEYGAGGATSQHSDNLTAGFLNFIGRPQPEEFQSFVHEQNWPVIRDRDYIFASWVWNMFDFASDLREEGDSFDLNTKGLVTADREVRKDAFYYYKAQWNPEPMIYLTGKRHAERAYPVLDVKAYSNADKAVLEIDGRVIGETTCPERICTWKSVRLHPGENRAVVTAVAGGTPVRDEAIWIGPDPAQGIRIDAGNLASRSLGGQRFGSDSFVTGGAPMVLNMGGFGGRRLMEPRTVQAPRPELYDFWREGSAFSYAIPVPNGRWTVTIHTFEPRTAGVDDTMMTVRANGQVALPAFSVSKSAGGALKGISRTFPVRVSQGLLTLDFAAGKGKAVIAAIEVTK